MWACRRVAVRWLATTPQVLAMRVTLTACALLAWVISQLRSESVRQEFA